MKLSALYVDTAHQGRFTLVYFAELQIDSSTKGTALKKTTGRGRQIMGYLKQLSQESSKLDFVF
jgi:hypothetical protein